jgi:uncharacterized RDD family membrane protein YckC
MAKTIEITTTQHVAIEYDLASLRERILAWVLDLLIIGFVCFLLFQLLQSAAGLFSESGVLILVLILIAGFFLYHIFFEIWNVGQTPGKKVMNIKVVRLDGKDPEWGDVVLRAILLTLDALFSFGTIAALLIKTTGKGQRLGDMAANTTVIKLFSTQYQYRLEDILNISSLQNYTPVYPQVRTLSEQDMIFIKKTLTRNARYPNQAHHEVVVDLSTRLVKLLDIQETPSNRTEFLKTLLRDYIVLTR